MQCAEQAAPAIKYRQQLAMQQKAAAVAKTAAAKEQLTSFTQNVVEKTTLIERLQYQPATTRTQHRTATATCSAFTPNQK